ncbi:hypothetical protein [Xanthomonas sacchari]|uniref:hypothetical protein n=1 Tax=Xanthomonas sacchari TaxID=56458 RepID=UPI00225491E7|nr:hypothetical protein [Xanthomonas sacchari]MCW0370242.1 hypothetical protein [Xanthomonas sacchari]
MSRRYIMPSRVDTPFQGDLATARKAKKAAAEAVRNVRARLKFARIGERTQVLLDLQAAKDAVERCRILERHALNEIEFRANELGLTTIRSKGASA